MKVKTLFLLNGKYEAGEVELKLLPGIPALHVVGHADQIIRDCGVKLKTALRSCGFEWPRGQQLVVSLRPMEGRKSSLGFELAVALAYLAATDQLSPEITERLRDHVVYGEIALDGSVLAPTDLARVLRHTPGPLLTGREGAVPDGRWWEIVRLNDPVPKERAIVKDWSAGWVRPDLPALVLHPKAAQALALAAHLELNVLIAGPQGTGKTTWATLLHALSAPPELEHLYESAAHFGDEVFARTWRPLESPHHLATPQALVGGGSPVRPGVITRAHGGVLILDEFLQFHPEVLEALREPVERGHIEVARHGSREKFPARFQLAATTNLCPCGKLNPRELPKRACSLSLIRCRSTVQRLSGPLLDRFDMALLSHEWTGKEARVEVRRVLEQVNAARRFALEILRPPESLVGWENDLGLGHRRQRAIARVARGLADFEESVKILPRHRQEAFELTVSPMLALREIFA